MLVVRIVWDSPDRFGNEQATVDLPCFLVIPHRCEGVRFPDKLLDLGLFDDAVGSRSVPYASVRFKVVTVRRCAHHSGLHIEMRGGRIFWVLRSRFFAAAADARSSEA